MFIPYRFKEDNIIDNSLYSFNNTLVIPAVGGLSGTYRCRVVNDFGSEFSDRAVLKVLGMYLHLSERATLFSLVRNSISNTSDCGPLRVITFPNIKKRDENMMRSGVFLTNFKVFGNEVKHCLERLIYFLNRS